MRDERLLILNDYLPRVVLVTVVEMLLSLLVDSRR